MIISRGDREIKMHARTGGHIACCTDGSPDQNTRTLRHQDHTVFPDCVFLSFPLAPTRYRATTRDNGEGKGGKVNEYASTYQTNIELFKFISDRLLFVILNYTKANEILTRYPALSDRVRHAWASACLRASK